MLLLGTWPTERRLGLRRVAFYLGAIWWLWVILGVVYGMFNAEFSLAVLIGGGAGLILLSMFAPRKKAVFGERELERCHRAGYERHPVQPGEVSDWEDEQVWGD